MPFESDRQRKAMYAAAEGRGTIGIDPAAARKFIKHSHEDKGMDNPLLKLLPTGKIRNAGKMIELKKQYDAAAEVRATNGKPKLPPFEQWPPVIAYKASVGMK